jgi:ketosteroid isomerase-like protein
MGGVVFGVACENEAPKPAPAEAPKAAVAPKKEEAKKAEAPKPLEGEALAKVYVDCWGLWSDAKWDKFGECYSQSAISSFPDSGQPALNGRDAIIANFKGLRSAFPDTHGGPEIVLMNGRTVATVGFETGTNSGPMKNPDGSVMPATNKKIGQHIFHSVTFDDKNQAVSETFMQDLGNMMAQLGVSKMPARPLVTEPLAGSPKIVVAKHDDTEKANVAMVQKVWDAFAKEDVKSVEAAMADDVLEADQGDPADHKGKKAVMDNCKMFLGAMSDLKQDCDTWGAGDYVVSQCKVSALNDGNMGKMFKKTGKTVNMSIAEVTKVTAGKISEVYRFYNGMAMAQQLGLIPPPAAAGEAKAAPAAPAKGTVKPASVKK